MAQQETLTYFQEKGVFVYGTNTASETEHLPGWARLLTETDEGKKKFSGYYTNNPYRAFTFVGCSDEYAQEQLQPIHEGMQEAFCATTEFVPPEIEYYTCCPEGKKLFPFQLAGVHRIVTRKRVFLADEPGLGKTIQAICARNIIRPKKTLVICPASLIFNWERELIDWSIQESTIGVFKPGACLEDILTKDIVIISYDSITPRIRAFMGIDWGFLIVDEAHKLKNENANRTKAILSGPEALLKKAPYYVLLSGTPSPNRLAELVTFIRHLRKDKMFGVGLSVFRDWYFNKTTNYFSGSVEYKTFKQERSLEWRALLYHDWFIRREKKDVLTQLPAKQHKLVTLQAGESFKDIIAECEKLEIENVSDIPSSALSAIAEIRHAFGIAKAPFVAEYVKELLDGGQECLVIFAYHKAVIDILLDKLSVYNPVSIRGGMTSAQKQKSVDTFQKDKKCRLIICNLEAGGVGYTLTAAHDVVFAEASYVPGENDQAMDRLHRIGQTEKVVAHFLSVPGTIDFNILKAFLIKQRELEHLNKNGVKAV